MSRGLVIAVLVASASARAADRGPELGKQLAAVRTDRAPVIDGSLGDAVWAKAAPDDRFTQIFPNEGQPPTERTEVRVLYDDQALYVGVKMYDSQPDGVVARLTRRDRDI